VVPLKMGRKVVFGTAMGRVSRPISWEKMNHATWLATDGNKNPVARISRLNEKQYTAEYTAVSLRLVCGPDTPFLNLGTYCSLGDAKKIVGLHERCETIPVFEPGRLIGWIDKNQTIDLYNSGKTRISKFRSVFIGFFITIWQLIRRTINGRR
jgi:hypothetical protein